MSKDGELKRIAMALQGDQLLALSTLVDSIRVVDVPEEINIKALNEAAKYLRATIAASGH